MSKNLKLEIEIDLDSIIGRIQKAESLESNDLTFAALSLLQYEKKKLELLNETFGQIEREFKQKINDKAKALYGPNWSAIAGTGYKISRSMTGQVYEVTDKVDNAFIDIKVSPNTKLINEFVKANSTLPSGVSYNPKRGESIRITVKGD